MAREFVRVRSAKGAPHEYSIDKKLYELKKADYELVDGGKTFETPLAPVFIEPVKPTKATKESKEAK